MRKYLKYMMATLGVAAGIVGTNSLISCSSSSDKNLSGTMNVTPTAKTLIITCGINDPDGIVNEGSARVAVYEYDDNDTPDDTSDDKQTLKENKTFSSLPNSDGSTETETVSGLKVNQDYLVKFYCTYGDKTHVFEETHYSTNNKGQSKDNPIEISTAKELYSMTDDNEAYYKLTADIDLLNYSGYDSTTGVSPIFTSSTPFKGTLDGDGHKITGFLEKTSIQYGGIFGYIDEEALIENITIDSPEVNYTRSSTGYYGVFAGYNKGTINNCNVTGANLTYIANVTTSSSPVVAGGFVGSNEGTITNCSISGTITSTYRGRLSIGGFVGENEKKIYADTPERVLKIYNEINDSQFQLAFDASNFIQCNVNAPEAYEMLKDKVVYYHIKDCSPEKVEVPIGLGEGGYENMIHDLIVNRKYDGFMTLEPHTGKYAEGKIAFNIVWPITWLIKPIKYWHRVFKRIDAGMGIKRWQKVDRPTIVTWQYQGLKKLLDKAYAEKK